MTIDEIENYISLTDEGIKYQSVAEKEFEGDFELLIACIEDNIILNEDDKEIINWDAARVDYRFAAK